MLQCCTGFNLQHADLFLCLIFAQRPINERKIQWSNELLLWSVTSFCWFEVISNGSVRGCQSTRLNCAADQSTCQWTTDWVTTVMIMMLVHSDSTHWHTVPQAAESGLGSSWQIKANMSCLPGHQRHYPACGLWTQAASLSLSSKISRIANHVNMEAQIQRRITPNSRLSMKVLITNCNRI